MSTQRHLAEYGFTLIEMLIVIAIIALLALILFPAFTRVRELARRTGCASNLKQIGMGILQYAQDYDGHFPSVFNRQTDLVSAHALLFWPYAIQPYVKSTQIFRCPDEATTNASSYLMNSYTGLINSALVSNPSKTLLAIDGNLGVTNAKKMTDAATGNGLNEDYSLFCQHYRVANSAFKTPRHMARANCLFCDGHVKISRAFPEVGFPTVLQVEAAIPFDTYIAIPGVALRTCAGWQ